MRKKFWSYRHVALFIIFILFAGFGIFTFAKFVSVKFHNYFLDSKHFYFTSNRLTDNNALYRVNNWSGVGSFTISFDLLSEKNSYIYTDYDIPYSASVTCPNDVICQLDKTTGIIYSSGSSHSDTVTVSVSPQRAYAENEILTVHIVATSSSPYIKNLSADFQYAVGKQGVTYEIEDISNQPYMMLKVTNAISFCTVVTAFGNYRVGDTIDNNIYRTLNVNDKSKCVSQVIALSFSPSILLLDTTSNIVDESTYTTTMINGVSYINSLTFDIAPVSTVAIKFYKVNPSLNYTYPIVNNTSVVGVVISDPTIS